MNLRERIAALITGNVHWTDEDTGEQFTTYENWALRWCIAGWPSHDWWWVRKYGKRDCGCTINPITRRHLLVAPECDIHGMGDDWLNGVFDDEDWD